MTNVPEPPNPNAVVRTKPPGTAGANQPYQNGGPGGLDQRPGPPAKSGWGCLLWGCLGTVLVSVLLTIGLGFAGYYALTGQVKKYTETTPQDFPIVEATEEEIEAIQERIERFQATAGIGEDSETTGEGEVVEAVADADAPADTPEPLRELVLTADDINALISTDETFAGKAFIEIQDDQLLAHLSFPTDAIPGGKGRFLNVDGELRASMDGGVLIVRLVDAKVKGEPLPGQFIDAISADNLAADLYNDPDNAAMLKKFETIEVRDGVVRMRLKEEAIDGPKDPPAEAIEVGTADAKTEPPQQGNGDAGGAGAEDLIQP